MDRVALLFVEDRDVLERRIPALRITAESSERGSRQDSGSAKRPNQTMQPNSHWAA
jgi:hypothetical protein